MLRMWALASATALLAWYLGSCGSCRRRALFDCYVPWLHVQEHADVLEGMKLAGLRSSAQRAEERAMREATEHLSLCALG